MSSNAISQGFDKIAINSRSSQRVNYASSLQSKCLSSTHTAALNGIFKLEIKARVAMICEYIFEGKHGSIT
jgi:hypothetical protein